MFFGNKTDKPKTQPGPSAQTVIAEPRLPNVQGLRVWNHTGTKFNSLAAQHVMFDCVASIVGLGLDIPSSRAGRAALITTGTRILSILLIREPGSIPRKVKDMERYVEDFLDSTHASFPVVLVRDLKRETGRTSKGS